VAAAGVFLAWGPLGLGNGPLWLPTASGGVYSWNQTRTEPVAYVLEIGNNGNGAAIIDGVAVTGSSRFASPVLQHALIGHMARYACTALGAISGHGSALAACLQPLQHGATGAVIPAGSTLTSPGNRTHQPALVLELAAPRPGQCWDITSVVVRYHIGIRHWVGTFPQANVITCGVGAKAPAL
jgi:hypothetical protein